MALPTGFPPRGPSGIRSIRFFKTGTLTAAFDGNAYFFANEPASANTFAQLPAFNATSTSVRVGDNSVAPPITGMPMGGGLGTPQSNGTVAKAPTVVWSHGIRICNDGSTTDFLEYSFDGVSVHGKLLAGEKIVYNFRHEGGIALRGTVGVAFRVEAW